MSRYWNKIVIDKLFSKSKKENVKCVVNTEIGRFYFYFNKETDSKVNGKMIFFPDQTYQNFKKIK
jgi:hypothetical protein